MNNEKPVDWKGVQTRLRFLLESTSISVATLSARSGLSQSLIYKMINHDLPVRPATIKRLCATLEISPIWLKTGNDGVLPDFDEMRKAWADLEHSFRPLKPVEVPREIGDSSSSLEIRPTSLVEEIDVIRENLAAILARLDRVQSMIGGAA